MLKVASGWCLILISSLFFASEISANQETPIQGSSNEQTETNCVLQSESVTYDFSKLGRQTYIADSNFTVTNGFAENIPNTLQVSICSGTRLNCNGVMNATICYNNSQVLGYSNKLTLENGAFWIRAVGDRFCYDSQKSMNIRLICDHTETGAGRLIMHRFDGCHGHSTLRTDAACPPVRQDLYGVSRADLKYTINFNPLLAKKLDHPLTYCNFAGLESGMACKESINVCLVEIAGTGGEEYIVIPAKPYITTTNPSRYYFYLEFERKNECRKDVLRNDYVRARFDCDPNVTASGITGASYTYSKLRDSCAALAVNLQQFSLGKGDVVGICMPNAPEFMISALGILEAGCTVTSFNPIYTADEISRQILNSNAKLMVCWVDDLPTVRSAVELTRRDIKILCAKSDKDQTIPTGTINFYDWIDSRVDYSALRTYDFDPSDTAFLPYSSGTTGLPKGVMLSHRNNLADCEMLEINKGVVTLPTTADQQEVILGILPFFHIYAWIAIFVSKLRLGSKVVTLPAFKPETFVEAIADHKATVLNLVPPLILFLGQSDLVKPHHVSSLRRVTCGAAPLGAKDADAIRAKAPNVNFGNWYGMTETTCAAILLDINKQNLGSPGYPTAASQVSLTDPEMKAIGPNESGELLLRGPHIMKGYLNNEEATKETLIANNWLRTGDIGYYDDQGQFYITDRLKELIKVKGFQVAPAELEEILRMHPNIAEAAVVGVSHPRTGEAPRAYVVAKKDKVVDPEEILTFLKDKVAHYKIPDSVVVADSIPKSATGKILRRQVKVKYGLV